jgi:hypothetical protein
MIKDKRGQEMSTNTIILNILGLIVLVILVLGFTIGWDKILPWIKSTNNVKEVSLSCETACTTSSTYDFCTDVKELKVGSDSFKETCNTFSSKPEYTQYGIKACPRITCP